MSENDLTPKHDAIHRGYATFGTDKASAARKASLIDAALNHLAFERSASCVLTAPDTDPEILVAIGTAENISKILPGAANKAAEEGGLVVQLPLLPEPSFKSRLNGGMLVRDAWDSIEMFEYARAAIAADRASRQVANKEEVDLSSLNVQTGADIELVYCNRDEEFVRLDEVKALFATPPATTGASTARDQALEEAARVCDGVNNHDNPMTAGDCADEIRALKGSVGASTVLTDERIMRLSEESTLNWWTEEGRPDNPTIIDFARAIEREVAAQAGQVASVPSAVAVPEQPIFTEEDHRMLHAVAAYMRRSESPRCSADLISLAERLRNAHQAAPSPAKESK